MTAYPLLMLLVYNINFLWYIIVSVYLQSHIKDRRHLYLESSYPIAIHLIPQSKAKTKHKINEFNAKQKIHLRTKLNTKIQFITILYLQKC